MARYPFLSPEWIAAAQDLRDEYDRPVPEITVTISANVLIVDAPFDNPTVEGHIQTSTATLVIGEGHMPEVDLTVELAYDLAHKLFVERDPQAAFQALFAGQIKVTGDSSKLLEIPLPSQSEPHPLASEIARRIDDITL